MKSSITEYLSKLGKKGGAARKKALSAKRRTQIARKAGKARWKKKGAKR